MAGLKEQLDAAGYDTSGMDEQALLKKLDAAGYDISNLSSTGPDLQQLQAEDKPVQDVSMTPVTQNDLDQAGESIATSKFGQQHPYLGAAAGTAVAKAPDILAAVQGIQAAPELASAVGTVGKGMAGMTKAAFGIGEAGEKELLAAKGALRELPIKYANKRAALDELGAQAGKEIEAAQGARGVGMVKQGIPTVPKDLNSFSNSMREVASKSPEELSQAMELDGLQALKDTITVTKQAGGLSPVQSAMVNRAAEKIDAAIAKSAPEIGEGLTKFRHVADAKEALGGDQIVEKMRLQNAIDKIRSDRRMSASTKVAKITKMLAKGAAVGAAGAFGFTKAKKFF